ncbi:MAG: glycosyltransferase [Solirubrobacteraceae bacterium]
MTASTERSANPGVHGEQGARRRERTARMAVVGMSTSDTCGVRDHATMLSDGLERENVQCSMHWLDRSQPTYAGARAEISSWAQKLAGDLRNDPPDALLLHYSVFAHSHRGLPVFVAPMVSALRESRIPLISFLHEFAFRQRGRFGLNGAVWSLSQRAALFEVMRASTAAVATVQERADWLASRVWLPRRPLAVAPVFSTLPPPTGEPRGEREGPLVGLFGYSCRPALASLVLDAVALLRERGLSLRLLLLGAPGAQSEVGEMWRSGARSRGIAQALCFSGTMSAQELSDMLAGCDLLLFVDRPGPTSRKTTLAGSLASGTAVVAIDGPAAWPQLVQARAAELTQPRPDALATAIETLLCEEGAREALAARGRAFAEQSMGVALSAEIVAGLLDYILDAASPVGRPDSHAARATP